MGDAPVETTVQQVLEGPTTWKDKDIYVVLFADREGKHSFFVPTGDTPPSDEGGEKGWFGFKKDGDPKFTRASENAPQGSSNGSSGAGRDDATGKSIERQKAADIAMNGMVGLDFGFKRESFAADYKFMFQVVHAEITGTDG